MIKAAYACAKNCARTGIWPNRERVPEEVYTAIMLANASRILKLAQSVAEDLRAEINNNPDFLKHLLCI